MGIRKSLWGVHDGQKIYQIVISNGLLELTLTNLGSTVVAITLLDENGTRRNMILGYDTVQEYIADPFYMGCIVGRFASRISNAAFRIGDTIYKLAANETGTNNHLHGGTIGFNKKVFDVKQSNSADNAVEFYYKSCDGEEGYPGNLDVYVSYTLTSKNEVIIDYHATTDKATHVNLTSHCYFNLSGSNTSALNHEFFINAEQVLVANDTYIPTGELKPVHGTDVDFTKWRQIKGQSNATPFNGYNECFSFTHTSLSDTIKAGLRDPGSGRSMTVKTTLPGLMLYTGDFLKTPFVKNGGICLEAQFFPDSPNQPAFPSTLLQPGAVYQQQTVYQFFDYIFAQ